MSPISQGLDDTPAAIVSLNEVWWYSVVALFFGAGPIRRLYLRAKKWIDRATGFSWALWGSECSGASQNRKAVRLALPFRNPINLNILRMRLGGGLCHICAAL
jgi:hypothetical protein